MRSDHPLLVAKQGETFVLRCPFSPGEDLVWEVGRGERNGQATFLRTGLVPAETPFEDTESRKQVFHHCGDDVAPWKTNQTYIGANHGASEVVRVTVPGHGLGTGEVGGAWRDEAGANFFLLGVDAADTLLFLSENFGTYPKWRFRQEITGNLLTRSDGGAFLRIADQRVTQLWPSCRMTLQCFAADGEVPDDGGVRTCRVFEISEEYDIVAPDAVARALAVHPTGALFDPVAANLEAILNNRLHYRFYPDGTCVVRHTAVALRDLEFEFMGFLQSAPLTPDEGEHLEYVIPGSLPFQQDDEGFDFRGGQRMPDGLKKPLHFSAALGRVADENCLPDQFVQFLTGEDGRRRVGFDLGYSRNSGLGVPEVRTASTDLAAFIYMTGKIYPLAINTKAGPIRAGHEFDCTFYRRYFRPGVRLPDPPL